MKLPLLFTIAASSLAAAQPPIRPQGETGERPTLFERWDANADGKLSPGEVPAGLRGAFDSADVDSNGSISADELFDLRRLAAGRAPLRADPDAPLGKVTGGPRAIAVGRMELLRDLPYAENDNPRQTLHLLLPRNRDPKAKLPLLVYIHGGAWQGGNKHGGIGELRKFVESGHYAGASIGYRLTGEAQWPAQIHDCKAAIRWLRGNAEKYRLDPARIGAFGHSAGGHLVAMLGTGGGVKELEGDLGKHDEESSALSCVGNFFGPAELLTMSQHPSSIDHDAENSPESRLLGGLLQEHKETAIAASPISHVDPKDPPMIMVHGTDDKLVPYPQSVSFEAALRKAGCDAALITIQGGGHGGFHDPRIDQLLRRFFAKHLRSQEAVIKSQTLKSRSR